jgi:protein SCO1/2
MTTRPVILAFNFAASRIASATETPPLAPPQARLLANVKFDQRLDSQTFVDAQFKDDLGNRTTLKDCIAGRTTVLVLAYYRCPMLCNQVLSGVARTLRGVNFKPGQDISVVVVSFDPSDTTQLAAAKKVAVVNAYRRGDDGAGWHFLTGDERTVRDLADSVGFQYVYDEKTQQFAHASGIVLLTPAGRVSRYFYGIDYPTRDVRLGLIEASESRIGSPVDQLLLFCFHYDPLTGRYGLAIMRTVRGTAIVFVACLLSYIGISLRREFGQRKEGPTNADGQPHAGSNRA